MTYAIAAAGTGGHIFPGLAVAEQLVAAGVDRRHVLFLGGDRLEAEIIPREGFPFVRLHLQGLVRGISSRNLRLPAVVLRAARLAGREMETRQVRAALCMGGYVTVPVAIAARRKRVPLYIHEQNVEAGLANRLVGRWADRSFVSFPGTRGVDGMVVGYPLRSVLAELDVATSRPAGLARYGFEAGIPTVGVMGGSLGARAINKAVTRLASGWEAGPLQIIHLAGAGQRDRVSVGEDAPSVARRVMGFEDRMDLFYAAADVVIARAGGGLMEAAVSGTPAILVPGTFGGRHQLGNATAMVEAGAALLVEEAGLGTLRVMLEALLADPARRERMGRAAMDTARPGAAAAIAGVMLGNTDALPG